MKLHPTQSKLLFIVEDFLLFIVEFIPPDVVYVQKITF